MGRRRRGGRAKFWLSVLTEIKNRGTADVCIVVCDGLKGLPEAINMVWERAIVQTCIIHLIRNTFRYASRRYWDQMSKDLRPVYTAPPDAAAKERWGEFAAKWGQQYPAIVRLWENAWAGSSGALPRRSPLRTGRASCPRIRLKQALWCRGRMQSGRRAARPCGRNGCERGVKRSDRSSMRAAGQRLLPGGGLLTGPR